jgi:hypothetical protein
MWLSHGFELLYSQLSSSNVQEALKITVSGRAVKEIKSSENEKMKNC